MDDDKWLIFFTAMMVIESFVILPLAFFGFLLQSDERVLILAFIFLLPIEPLTQVWKRGTASYARTSILIWLTLSITMGFLLPLLPVLFSMPVRFDWMAIILIPTFAVLVYIRKRVLQEDIARRSSKELSEEYYSGI
ncbi:MAG: hypothetical protein ACW974_11730 [Candidatus Thorarchaeota archaeon]|jgi:hypothetical protein